MTQMLFRIAVRTVATGANKADVVFYLADSATMEGAMELARFPKSVLQGSPGLFDKLVDLFAESLNDFVEEVTGHRPEAWRRREPLEPREGQA
jgi:hypothetical protein